MNSATPFDLRVATTAVGTPLHEFVEKNAPALRNAAAVIGGRGAVQTVNRLFDDLWSKPRICLAVRRSLRDLRCSVTSQPDSFAAYGSSLLGRAGA